MSIPNIKKNSDLKRFIRKIFSKDPDKYQIYKFEEQCVFCKKNSIKGRRYTTNNSESLTFVCSKCLKALMKQYPKLTDKFYAKRKKKEDKNRAALQLKEAEDKRTKTPKKDNIIPSENVIINKLPISEILQGKRGKRIYCYFICNRCGKQCDSGWGYSQNIRLCDSCKSIIKFNTHITIFYTPMGNGR